MEFKGLAQLDDAFGRVVPRQGDMEREHVSFNKFVEDNIQHALYRDWPDNIQKQKTNVEKDTYTTEELVDATKKIYPELWQKEN